MCSVLSGKCEAIYVCLIANLLVIPVPSSNCRQKFTLVCRCLTEAPFKRRGIVIDGNPRRALTALTDYAASSSIRNLQDRFHIMYRLFGSVIKCHRFTFGHGIGDSSQGAQFPNEPQQLDSVGAAGFLVEAAGKAAFDILQLIDVDFDVADPRLFGIVTARQTGKQLRS